MKYFLSTLVFIGLILAEFLSVDFSKKENLNQEIKIPWYYFDVNDDSIPGISLKKAKNYVQNKNSSNVIIAIIDTEIDIESDQLKKHIWYNSSEILGNNIDDDNNGYIDDIHGWNFLGNIHSENLSKVNYEYVRIVRFYDEKFKGKDERDISADEINNFKIYKNSLNKLNLELKRSKRLSTNTSNIIKKYTRALVSLDSLSNLSETELTEKRLDCLKNIYPSLLKKIELVSRWKKRGRNLKSFNEFKKLQEDNINIYLNVNYDDRYPLKDNPDDILDTKYGNNHMLDNIDQFYHGTQVAGVVSEVINENENIKIMSLCIAVNGDEQDKDIALAIRYAVDNGAKVINYSSGKYYSLHQEWVKEALLYAFEKDVVVVFAAGNSNLNIDLKNFEVYPKDYNDKGIEFVNNVLRISSSSNNLNGGLISAFSNYGKQNIDIFAPGDSIQTLLPHNKTKWDRGTSLSSPLVSGVAALIRSYYPSLTASEVKQILMDSSVKYDILVDVPTKENPDQQLPFSELSKSGGIVNAYNAMLMAEEYVKKKK